MITTRAKFVSRLAAVIAAATVAAPAQAATPFNIGNGLRPSVTVDAAGNGYFAWLEKRASTMTDPGQIHFCKVLVGTTSCAVKSQFAAPSAGLFAGEAAGYPQVFLMANGQPTIFTNCRQCFGGGDRGSQFVSTNGGGSFVPRATARSASSARSQARGRARTSRPRTRSSASGATASSSACRSRSRRRIRK